MIPTSIISNYAVAMMLQRRGRTEDSRSVGPDLPWGDLSQIAFVLVLGLVLWYIGQRLLAWLLIRKTTSFCPRCFGARIRPAVRRPWELLFPFLPVFRCGTCGERFFRGRKPPFARCPKCRSSSLETAPRVGGTLRNLASAVVGGHGYRCFSCGTRFADSRPLRTSVQPQAGSLQNSSPTGQQR